MTQEYVDGGGALEAAVRDHNLLRILVQAAIQDVERTDRLAPSLVAPLAQHLLAHFRRAEAELFPLAEGAAGDPRLPKTESLRREHLVLREFLCDIESALARRDRAGARGTLLELAASLRLHCDQEDALYFKTLDVRLGGAPAGPSASVKDKTHGT